jgi:hypothetical protein
MIFGKYTDFWWAKGVVANIPYVNTLPFFTIATNPVPECGTGGAIELLFEQ